MVGWGYHKLLRFYVKSAACFRFSSLLSLFPSPLLPHDFECVHDHAMPLQPLARSPRLIFATPTQWSRHVYGSAVRRMLPSTAVACIVCVYLLSPIKLALLMFPQTLNLVHRKRRIYVVEISGVFLLSKSFFVRLCLRGRRRPDKKLSTRQWLYMSIILLPPLPPCQKIKKRLEIRI